MFEHDGAFFTLRELAALLSGGSSKDFESEDTTGRFGTGFLVTHVLAPRTRVSGILNAGVGLEQFDLLLDRDGDEDSIVANIAACDAAIRTASPLPTIEQVASASFGYVTDDAPTLQRGIASFRAAVPYLFATCELLGRVSLEASGGSETWEASASVLRAAGEVVLRERHLACRREGGLVEYRAIRVESAQSSHHAAVAVLARVGSGWRFLVPDHDFPRVFCRYPIRSSSFLPINAILDAPFDLDQERRRILLDKEDVRGVFHSAMSAVVPLVRIGFEEAWEDRHLLAHAAPARSSFADSEDQEEAAWLTGELLFLARQLSELPLVSTRNGVGPAVRGTEHQWFADFLDADGDGTTMSRLWPLVYGVPTAEVDTRRAWKWIENRVERHPT